MGIAGRHDPLRPEPARIVGPRVVTRRAPASEPRLPEEPVTAATPGTITGSQRSCLFGWAARRGLSTDDLRAATSTGSIRRLSRDEAARLIELLSGGTAAGDIPDPAGTVTAAQMRMLVHLQQRIGWTAGQCEAWLLRHFHVHSLERITTRERASGVIAAMMRVLAAREGRS